MNELSDVNFQFPRIFSFIILIAFGFFLYLLIGVLNLISYPGFVFPEIVYWSLTWLFLFLFSFVEVGAAYTLFRPARLVVTSDCFLLDAGMLGRRVTRWADVDRFVFVHRRPFLPEVGWVLRDPSKRRLNRLIGYDGIIPLGMYWSGRRFKTLMESYLEDYRRLHSDVEG